MTRRRRIREISNRLGDRTLVWFGIRGDDAAAYLPISQFRRSYAITAPLSAAKLERSRSLEDLTGQRVDLDEYDIDFDQGEHVRQLRTEMLSDLTRACAAATYRPSHFLSALAFATNRTSLHLGLFKDRQMAFEHKPWVETELERIGIRIIPWEYVPIERRDSISRLLDRGPVILRPSRTSGGAGIELVRNTEELESFWHDDSSHLMGVAPFFENAIAVNVGGCAFGEGAVTLHPCSVQLIGLPSLTHRPFGYCGNDFAAVRQFDRPLLEEIDGTTRRIGRWLCGSGYRGAFGVDYLIADGQLYFAEVNARMQGSTRLSSDLAIRTDHVDLCLDHLAAFLHLPPAESLNLLDWLAEIPDAAQIIRHNLHRYPVHYEAVIGDNQASSPVRISLEPSPGVKVDPGGVLCRLEFDRRITTTGSDLVDGIA